MIRKAEKGSKCPKNFDRGFFAPLAMIEIFPADSIKTSAMIDVSPKDLACKRKHGSQLCGILIAAHSKAA
jgi:hypothetical protein